MAKISKSLANKAGAVDIRAGLQDARLTSFKHVQCTKITATTIQKKLNNLSVFLASFV
jgi:hypothetical protein